MVHLGVSGWIHSPTAAQDSIDESLIERAAPIVPPSPWGCCAFAD